MNDPTPLAPDYFCPNPDAECPGHGKDLQEIREPITDDSGHIRYLFSSHHHAFFHDWRF